MLTTDDIARRAQFDLQSGDLPARHCEEAPNGFLTGGEAPHPAKTLFILVLAYLFIDYGRPQDTIPGLGALRPAMVVTVLLALALLGKREMWARSSAQLWSVFAFVVILAAHVPFARNNFFAYGTTKYMVLLLPMVFALPACIKSVGTLRTSLGFCLALMAYQATFASLHGGRGTGAQFTDENDLSLFVNTYLPFAFCLFMGEKRFRVRVFYFMTIVAGVAGVVASRSRGGFVGLVAIGAVIWLVSRRKILALVVVALVAFGLVQFASDAYWARMATSTEADAGTGKERIESWKSGWNMFLDNPLGVGGNNFQVRFPDYQTEYFRRGMWGRVAHSLWLTVVAELGIPGAAIYLVLLVANVRACFRLRHIGQEVGGDNGRLLVNIGSAMLASMVGFFASATFLSVLYYAHYWYLTGFIVAASEIAQSLRESGPSQLATTA